VTEEHSWSGVTINVIGLGGVGGEHRAHLHAGEQRRCVGLADPLGDHIGDGVAERPAGGAGTSGELVGAVRLLGDGPEVEVQREHADQHRHRRQIHIGDEVSKRVVVAGGTRSGERAHPIYQDGDLRPLVEPDDLSKDPTKKFDVVIERKAVTAKKVDARSLDVTLLCTHVGRGAARDADCSREKMAAKSKKQSAQRWRSARFATVGRSVRPSTSPRSGDHGPCPRAVSCGLLTGHSG
jgi:hypothetical protein